MGLKGLLTAFCIWLSYGADLSADTSSKTKFEKRAEHWNEIERTAYKNLPSNFFLALKQLASCPTALLSLGVTLKRVSDRMPWWRGKVIHMNGAEAMMRFDSSGKHPFTGFLAEDDLPVLGRMSLAVPPWRPVGFIPGIALKFYADGDSPSVNLQMLHSTDSQGTNSNVFLRSVSNILERPKGLLLRAAEKMVQILATKNVFHLGLDHMSDSSSDGSLVQSPVVPYQLEFLPVQELRELDGTKSDFRFSLLALKAPRILYEVYGLDKPQGTRYHVGSLYLDSPFSVSRFGQRLFFQHREFRGNDPH